MRKEFVFRLLSFVTLLSIALGGLASAVLPLQLAQAQAVVPLQPQGAGLAPRTGTFYPYPTGLSAQAPAPDHRGVSHVAYSPDGLTLGVGTPFGGYLYDAATLQGLRFLNTGSPVTAMAFSPIGNLLATGSFTDTVQIWDVQNGDLLYTLATPQGSINSLAFSPDGNSVATASADGAIRLWDFQSGSILQTMRGHLGAALTVDFSPDGSLIASGGMDGSVRLWRISDGLGISSLVGSVGGVQSVKYAPDGITLGLGSGDGLVRLWQTRTGKVLLTLSGHKAGVTDLAFAPDGFSLTSSSLDRTLIVWQVSDGRQIRSLTGSTGALMSVAFSPGGAALAAGAIDGAVLLFSASAFIGRVPGLAAPLCVDNAAFIADVTIPDNTLVAPGTAFTKAWRFSNTGTCTFGPGYRLAFVTGDQLGAASTVPMTSLAPGAIFDISVPMVAPVIPGIYTGVWQLLNPSNVAFGPRVTVVIQVGPAPNPPYTLDISASDTEINADDSVTIQASVSGVAAAWVNGDPVINNFYSKSFRLCDDTTFTLNVVLPNGGTDSRSVTVYVNGSCDNNADIRIRSLTADDTTPDVGQTVRFSARLRNEGNSDADNFDLEWRPSDGANYRVVVSGIDLNQDDETTVSWDFTYNSAGVFRTTARVEVDGNTDTRSLSVTVGGGPIPPVSPDLVVTSFTADNTNPAVGDTVNFSAVIANQGDGPADNFRVVWRPSQSSPFQLKASGLNLQPNGSTTVNFSFTFASAGTFITEVVVDDTNLVNESNEGNNARSLAITVGGGTPQPPGFANVVISDLTADDTAPAVGQIVNFTVALANQGGAEAQNYQVVWRPSSSSPFEAKASGLTIPANGQTTVNFSYAFPQEGTFTTEAVVVPGQLGGAQALAAAPTNAFTLDITVGPAVLAAPTVTSTVQALAVTPTVISTAIPEGTPTATAEPTSTGEPEGEPTAVVEPTATAEPTSTEEQEGERTPTPTIQPQEGSGKPSNEPEQSQEELNNEQAKHAAEVATEQAKKAAEQAAETEKRAAEAAKKVAEEDARHAAEAQAAQLKAQQEADQKAAEEDARREAEAQAAQLKAQQEAAQKAAEEAAQAQEEQLKAQQEAARHAAEQAAEAAKHAAEEEARRAAQAQEEQLKAQQEAARHAAEQAAEAARRAAEEEARRAANAQAEQLKAQQEAAKHAAEQAAEAAKRAAEEEARRAANAQAEQLKAQQEAAKHAAEQEAEQAKHAAERERRKQHPTPTPLPTPEQHNQD